MTPQRKIIKIAGDEKSADSWIIRLAQMKAEKLGDFNAFDFRVDMRVGTVFTVSYLA